MSLATQVTFRYEYSNIQYIYIYIFFLKFLFLFWFFFFSSSYTMQHVMHGKKSSCVHDPFAAQAMDTHLEGFPDLSLATVRRLRVPKLLPLRHQFRPDVD